MSDQVVSIGGALLVLAGLSYLLYRPRVQQSPRFQATVVPLANIMDVGFIVFAPAFVLLAGYAAPLFMLGVCLVAISAGFAIAYNIRHYEPLIGTGDRLNRVDEVARWALLAASMINIAYYTLLLVTLALWPLDLYTEGRLAVIGAGLLALIVVIGWFGGLDRLNRTGALTTAFNLSAIVAILFAFLVFNIQEALGGRWDTPERDWSISGEEFRKLIGLFAIVQGFEAARYIGNRFGGELRVSAMRVAQGISTVVFVLVLLATLLLFSTLSKFTGTTIFLIADEVGDALPWLILVAALGSQTSAIVNATVSRSDMLVERNFPRRVSFLIVLVPALVVFLLADVTQVIVLASRVFAGYFTLQAFIAGVLAWRRRHWAAVAGFAAVGLAMATVMIFGLPV